MSENKKLIIGLVDADLMDGGTRHPNLVMLKLAGFLHDNNIPFELIEDENDDIENIIWFTSQRFSPLLKILNSIKIPS